MRTYKGKGPKVLILVIVCVLLAGFSIGFSALSQSLLIKSHASINPTIETGALGIKFSSKVDELSTANVVPTVSSADVAATNAKIDNENIAGPTISNFSVELSEEGDKATYVFYAMNTGSADAYLTNVTYNNVEGESSHKVCTAIYGTTETDATSLCDNIKVTVQAGDLTTTATTPVTDHTLAAGASEQITITVEYINNVTAPSTAGDFIAEFGDISLLYSSVDGEEGGEGGDTGDSGDTEESGTLYIYINSEEKVYIGDSIDNITYETTPLNISQNTYLKHEVVNNVVTASYACITYTEDGIRKDVCLRGGDATYYASNQEILHGVEPYFNTLEGCCSFSESRSGCRSASLDLDARSGGSVYAGGGSAGCSVISDGDSYCSES